MPDLSVIIPTVDRQDFAEIVVRKIIDRYPQYEVVVSDASADDSLRLRLADLIATARIVYTRPGTNLTVVQNFEHARQMATGDYFLFLGDDDCVGPDIDVAVTWAKMNAVEALASYTFNFPAVYLWPGIKYRTMNSGYDAKLFIKKFNSATWPVDGRKAIEHTLGDAGTRGPGLMPRAYHGLVSRALVDRIVARYGAMFGGVSPDIFSATLISAEAASIYRTEYPFCLPGGSPKSTAGLAISMTHRAKLRENPHIAPFKDLVWDPLIPEFYSPLTVWAFSFKKALDMLADQELVPNYVRLYARCLLYNREYATEIIAAIRNYERLNGGIRVRLAAEIAAEAKRFVGRVARRLRNPRASGFGNADRAFSDIPNIAEALDVLTDYLAGERISFEPCAIG